MYQRLPKPLCVKGGPTGMYTKKLNFTEIILIKELLNKKLSVLGTDQPQLDETN